MLTTVPNATSRRAISELLHRAKGTPSSRGRLQASAVVCARTSGGKTPGSPWPWQVLDASLLRPAPSPFPNNPARTSSLLSNLKIAPFWVIVGS
jgi:hypothetical protein